MAGNHPKGSLFRARSAAVLAGVLSLALVATGCVASGRAAPRGFSTGASTPNEPITAATTPVVQLVPAPLTGLPVDPSVLARPVIGVKIDNHPEARPQSGLDIADVVYEELVEGGITRFLAVFHSKNAGQIGPVRSARWEDPDILRQYGTPLFAFSGGAGVVIRKLKRSRLVMLNETSGRPAYRRVGFRRRPHNLYTSTQGLYSVGGRRGTAPQPLFNRGDLSAPAAVGVETNAPAAWPATASIRVPMSDRYISSWRYDPLRKQYLRFQGSAPHITRSGKQLGFRNVLVMFVSAKPTRGIAAVHKYSPNVITTGHGRAVLLRDGVRVEGVWRRGSLDSVTRFLDESNRSFLFAPGRLFVELVPLGRHVTFSTS